MRQSSSVCNPICFPPEIEVKRKFNGTGWFSSTLSSRFRAGGSSCGGGTYCRFSMTGEIFCDCPRRYHRRQRKQILAVWPIRSSSAGYCRKPCLQEPPPLSHIFPAPLSNFLTPLNLEGYTHRRRMGTLFIPFSSSVLVARDSTTIPHH